MILKKSVIYFGVVLFIILISSCKTNYYNVIHINETSTSKSNGLFYYLPRTIVVADVMIKKTTYHPGPFSEYAEQYIGYSGIQSKSTLFEIENIILSTKKEPDPDQLYFIELNKKTKSLFELEENGLLRNVNIQSTQEEKREQKKEKEMEKGVTEKKQNMLTLLNIREKLDTIYKRQIIDSVVVESRSIERVYIKNTKEESAREAAKKIGEIRTQRFNLISYNEEIGFEAGALEAMLRELNKMEEDYFRLFLGYSESESVAYHFEFTPNDNIKGYQNFFKFSPTKGVNDSLRLMMETVYITQDKDNLTQKVKDFTILNEKNKSKKDSKYQGLAYRLPEMATYKIIWNNKVLATAEFPIAQLGTVQYLPPYDLENLKVNFDIDNGNIRLVNFIDVK